MYIGIFVAALSSILPLVTQCSPLVTRVPHVVHERRELSSGWVKRSRLPSNTRLPVRIALSQSNLDYGHDLLMEM